MNKTLTVIGVTGVFVSGLMVGGFGVANFFGHLNSRLIGATAAAEAGIDVQLLKKLRANDTTNAVAILETRLDGSLMQLGFFMKDMPEPSRDPEWLKTLETAKEYREQFPHSNAGYPEIDQSVSNAFLLVSSKP